MSIRKNVKEKRIGRQQKKSHRIVSNVKREVLKEDEGEREVGKAIGRKVEEKVRIDRGTTLYVLVHGRIHTDLADTDTVRTTLQPPIIALDFFTLLAVIEGWGKIQ